MSRKPPLVSVITATYNRSNVLRCTIASLLRSSLQDWELLVVGDGCTDDTREVVASFPDPRIRFFNLAKNFGDQGGPNNEGLRLATGTYVAYLSHDDLWLPEHLALAVQTIRESAADLVHTFGLAVGAGEDLIIPCASSERAFEAVGGIPASLWVAKRELLERVGPWRHPSECVMPPSQELLVRIWRHGARIVPVARITAIIVASGRRPGVYARREGEENRRLLERMQSEPDFLQRELERVFVDQARRAADLPVLQHVRTAAINLAKRTGRALGISPTELTYRLLFCRKGSYINHWRRKIGLQGLQ